MIFLDRLRSPRRAALFGGAMAVAAACVTPTGMCGCPPARSHAIAYGTVRTAAGSPVAGATVGARIHYTSCATEPAQVADSYAPEGYTPPLPTTAAGEYEMRFYSFSGGPQCVRVVARLASGDSAFTQVPSLAFGGERDTAPRTRVDVVFP
jgi:hypothetical protein